MSFLDPESWFETSKQTEHRRMQERQLESLRAQERHLDRIADAAEASRYDDVGGYVSGYGGVSRIQPTSNRAVLLRAVVVLVCLAITAYVVHYAVGLDRSGRTQLNTTDWVTCALGVVAILTGLGFMVALFFGVINGGHGVRFTAGLILLFPSAFGIYWCITGFMNEYPQNSTGKGIAELTGYGALGLVTVYTAWQGASAVIRHGKAL